MINQDFDVNEYVEQMSMLLNMPIKEEYKIGIIANFEKIKSIAEIVNNFTLTEEIEVAPIFEP